MADTYRVLTPFRTPSHSFAAGEEITVQDLDGILTAADWQRMGAIEPILPPATLPAPKAAATAKED